MEKSEFVVLGFIVAGMVSLSAGLILYTRKIMVEYLVSWELQLALFGLIVVVLGLMFSKILSKVNG